MKLRHFHFGREDLIPKYVYCYFEKLSNKFPRNGLGKLIYYFERHIIELDADK
jgi:hypothetical protein